MACFRFFGVMTSTFMVALYLGGCLFEPNSAGDITGDDPNFIETNLTDPAAVLNAFSKAFNTRNLEAYSALLDSEFMHYPLERDAEDFPWLPGVSWDKATELDGIATLFDPSYSGPPHPLFGEQCAVTELSRRATSEGGIELICIAEARLLAAENEGWSSESRLIFTLINRDGFWRIWKLTEIDPAGNTSGNLGVRSWES